MTKSAKRYRLWGWFAVLWVSWALMQVPYTAIRSTGDDLWKPHDLEPYERSMFGGTTPQQFLQTRIYTHDVPWFDYAGYLLHGMWFGVPFAFGIVIMMYQRQRLLEFLSWLTVLVYLCSFSFALFPVRPPWMETGITRVLAVRHAEYLVLDNNPMAAFPSLHAGLPFAVALFLFFRCGPKLRFYAWVALGYAFAVSFAIVYLGEHWVIDVVGGYGAAALTGWICTSRKWQQVYSRIPGDPVGRLSALNSQICAPNDASSASESEPAGLTESLRQAA